jgi:hypothetical protein
MYSCKQKNQHYRVFFLHNDNLLAGTKRRKQVELVICAIHTNNISIMKNYYYNYNNNFSCNANIVLNHWT